MKIFVGIDWGQETNALRALRPDGSTALRFQFEQTADGIAEAWRRVLVEAGSADEVAVGIERPHGAIVEFLTQQNATVYPLNPKAVDRARDRHRASSAKDDDFDAFVIADLLRTDLARLRPLEKDSELARELKGLSRQRDQLVAQRTAFVNQLQAALRLYFVAAIDLFTDLAGDISLAFLADHPTPQAAAALTKRKLRAWLKAHGYRRPDRVDEIHKALQQPPLPADDVTVRVQSRLVCALVAQLQPLALAIASYERAIAKLFETHPNHDQFTSLPGAGEILAPKLAAELGGESLKRLSTDELRGRAGTAPVTIATGKTSGKRAIVVFRRACSKPLRQALQQHAMASVPQSAWAAAYFAELIKRGKGKAAAYRSLANKWLAIIIAMLRDGTQYDEQKYIAALRGRAAWLPASN